MTTQLSKKGRQDLKEQLEKAKEISIKEAIKEEKEEESSIDIAGTNSIVAAGNGITATSGNILLNNSSNLDWGNISGGGTSTYTTLPGNLSIQQPERRLMFIYKPIPDITVKELARILEYTQPHYPKHFTEGCPELDEPFTRHFLIEGRDDEEIEMYK